MVKLKCEYDGNNLRQSKTTNGVKTSHIYDGQNIVLDVTENGNTVYNRGIGLINRENNGVKDYYHFNIHGDTVALTDINNQLTVNYQYDAFGNQLTNTENDTNPFRYCGEYFDEETGFIYLRNRYYDPSLGRFITEDPIKDGINWYVYANNNPVIFVDPSGLRSKEEADKIIKDNATYIISAAEEFGVNPGILAATIYAEQRLNVDWKDDYIDGIVGFYNSLGTGQFLLHNTKK